jgi:N-acetylmuramoyl-L-alanine amidase
MPPTSPESFLGLMVMQEEFMYNSITLASKIEDKFSSGLQRKSRGVKEAPYMVLHKAYMPRVLVEMGFISNPAEGEFLNSEEGRQAIAEQIAAAIISYKNEYYGNGDELAANVPAKVDHFETASTQPVVSTDPRPVTPQKNASGNSNNIIYKVQISASGKNIPLTASNFKGLTNLSVIKEGGLYKYMYGGTENYDEAMRDLRDARAKGFQTAYLVGFKNGQKIKL